MSVRFMHTPTIENTFDLAAEPFSVIGTTPSQFGLSARGRDGTSSLRIGSADGIYAATVGSGRSASDPFRMSFDVLLDASTGGNGRLVMMPNRNASRPTLTPSVTAGAVLMVATDGVLSLGHTAGGSFVTATGSKGLTLGTVHTVEVEAVVVNDTAQGRWRVWVDGELSIEYVGQTASSSPTTGVEGARFGFPFSPSNTLGAHISNVLLRDGTEAPVSPVGPLDFRYIPVADPELGETTIDDSGAFETLTGSTYTDYTLSADNRTGEVIAHAPIIRSRTGEANPGKLDIKIGTDERPNIAVESNWKTFRGAPKAGPLPATTISLRNSPGA